MPRRKLWLLLLPSFMLGPPVGGKPVSHGNLALKPVPIGGHRAAALRRGRLVAWDMRTGRRLWAFGHGLGGGWYRDEDGQWETTEGLILAANGRIFTYSHLGRIYAISAQTGELLWSAAARTAADTTKNKYGTWRNFDLVALDGDADTLAAADYHGLIVYEAATGRARWRIALPPDDTGSTDVNLTPGLLLLERFTEGAGMHTVTDAYNRRTGKLLWTGNGSFDPERSHGGKIGLASFSMGEFMDRPTWLHHQVVEERTGKVLKEYLTK